MAPQNMAETMNRFPTVLACLVALAASAPAQLIVPSDGSDGAFNPTQNVTIDLGLATTAPWQTPGNGNGVYDPEQWAVVFKFTEVNIPAGVTVSFKNHPKGAPVVWLVQGNVTIGGLVSVNSGPGGFAEGFGVGGLALGYGANNSFFGSSSFAFHGGGRSEGIYGGPELVPLVGGSGARESRGGGAILIMASQEIVVAGSVQALGGGGTHCGTGGAVRLVADHCTLQGSVFAYVNRPDVSSQGRIRLEANSFNVSGTVFPTPSVLNGVPNNTPQLWPDASAPQVRIESIAGRPVQTDPAGNMSLPDLQLTTGGTVPVVLATTNVPSNWKVTLRVAPTNGQPGTIYVAQFDPQSGKWVANVNIFDGSNYMVAKVAAPGYPD